MEGLLALLNAASVLVFVAGGLALIVGVKKPAGMLLAAGVGLGVLAAVAPGMLAAAGPMALLDVFAAGGLIAAVGALFVRQLGLAFSLAWPAISRWLMWPTIASYLDAGTLWLLALVILPFSAFILIWLLQRVLAVFYGREAASHVAGEYLVRTLDATGRTSGSLLRRLFGR